VITYETRFHQLLRKAIEDEIDRLARDLSQGAAQDFATYRWAVGMMEGLRTALALAERTESDMSKAD